MARDSRKFTSTKMITAALLLGVSGSALAGFDFVFTPNISGGIGNFRWDVNVESAAAVPNPGLKLLRGHTYSLHANASVTHPFWIKTAPSTGATNAYSPATTELDGNDLTAAGTLIFAPGASTPDRLYYDCGVHFEMQGVIDVPLFADGFE
jgi:hypothetical protein